MRIRAFFSGTFTQAMVVTAAFCLPCGTVHADPFKEALAAAYSSNPELKSARESLNAADEQVSQAISGWRPTASYNMQRGHARTRIEPPWTSGFDKTRQLTVEQPIFEGGSSIAQYKGATKRVQAGRAQLHASEQQVLFGAVTSYADVVEKQSEVELNHNNVEVLTKQLQATRQRFEVGELTRTDVAQSEARLSRAQSDERQAEGDLEGAKATFQRVMGYPPGGLELPPVPENLPGTVEEATLLAKDANPDLVAARYQEEASGYDVDARKADLLPKVSLQGNMQRANQVNVFPAFEKLDTDSVLLNVRIPLYQSGAEYSRVREAESASQKTTYDRQNTDNTVVETVRRAWEDFHSANAVIDSTGEAIKASDIALAGVREEQQYGVRTTLDVLDAEQELFANKVSLVRAQHTQCVNSYRLLASVGRLTAKDLGLDVELYDPEVHYDNVKYKPFGF